MSNTVSVIEYADSIGVMVEEADKPEPPMLFKDSRFVLMDEEDFQNLQVLVWALANDWMVERISCYDEEGVPGWRWTTPDGEHEYELVCSHDEVPEVPDEVSDIFMEWFERESGERNNDRWSYETRIAEPDSQVQARGYGAFRGCA